MNRLLYIDLFCGAGGTSTGVNSARLDGEQCAEVIACVNHDAKAIASHAANHPNALHFTEDIRTLDLAPLMEHLAKCRAENPNALIALWASLECTNFSKAKGGQPRDADSRTLAEHLFRYIEAINPDYIQIENVEEFMSWGSLDENGRPLSKDRGRCYVRWVNKVKRYGYDYQYRIMNAADYGAYTSRKRFFGIFAKNGLPIVFPEPTHSRHGESGLFGDLEKWKPVSDVLDFEDEGKSIFERKKSLSEKTLERIYAGLIKFVAGGKDAFLVKYNSVNKKTGKYVPPSLDEPCPTVATQQRLALASVSFLSKQFSGGAYDKNISVDAPAGTITTVDHHAFISVHYGHGFNSSCDNPAPTLTTKDRLALVSCHFMANEYSGGGQVSSIERPNPAVLTNPKQKIVTVKRWLLNPQYASSGGSVESPCFTLIAGMDKMPPYLITTEHGDMAIEIYDTDSPMTIKIKEFMAMYQIIDITMRMLKIEELLAIMGFPEDYVLIGTQADQKKFIGNAVEVNMARCLCEALCLELNRRRNRSGRIDIQIAEYNAMSAPSKVINIDCMEFMRSQPDGTFDLAIVDPPYFSGPERRAFVGRRQSPIGVNRIYHQSDQWQVPGREYFEELRRVARHYIVFGCNYYDYQFPPGRIVWDKCNGKSSFSDCELAATDLFNSVRMFRFMWNGMLQGKSISEGHIMQPDKSLNEKRIHPTQKPVLLYAWLLESFAARGWRILDTHLGSGSSRIAAYKLGYNFTGCEIDPHYMAAQQLRFEQECLGCYTDEQGHSNIQLQLFDL